MPLAYSGILEEALVVRQAAGLFDLSHLGQIEVSGPGAAFFLQRMLTRDLSRLPVGKAAYALMCNEHGGIMDDLLAYRMLDRYLLVVNAATARKDFDWLRWRSPREAQVTDVSDRTSLLALQGPASASILKPLSSIDPSGLARRGWARGEVAGQPALIARTGYTGEDGFELMVAPERAERVWDTVLSAGRPVGLKPCGLGARDILRLEAGFLLYGEDIDEHTNPLEADLERFVDFSKAFVGREALLRVRSQGPRRRLVGLELQVQAIPRGGCPLLLGGKPVGEVTSGAYSPTLKRGIGLGYVESACATPGTGLDVLIRARPRPARVVRIPFVKSA